MSVETKKWLKSTSIANVQGQPLLLMYLLEDKEIEVLAYQIDQLVEYRILEREGE